jgi:CubicO group peptidase (beta-lactamase class C family)
MPSIYEGKNMGTYSGYPDCFTFAITSIFLIFTSPILVHGQTSRQEHAGLESLITRVMREEKIPGCAIGIVEDGRLVYSRGFGLMKVGDPGRPVTPKTLFHMASITKPFVATAVMQLVERGKLDLNAPVSRYLRYFRLRDPRYKDITVRQMVTHTSGMPDVENYDWDKPEYDDGALERYVRSLGDKTLLWEPGDQFRYSNMAFEVLGDLVAKVSGMSFEDYLETSILKPVGMHSSTLLYTNAKPADLATGHTITKGVVSPVARYPYNRAHTPSSNLHSNVEDMARWMIVNLNRGELDGQHILKSSTYELLWKPAAQVPDQPRHVAISWFLADINGEQFVGHGGSDDGFRTDIAFSTSRKIGVVMMFNSDHVSSIQQIREAALGIGRQAPVGK